MADQAYLVAGMTCAHCVAAVSIEVGAVPGVTEVRLDLATHLLQVSGSGYSDAQIAAAVDEAGYRLAETSTNQAQDGAS